MKDDLNIEQLFQDKLGNLEQDVNPNLWNNIQQGITAQAGTAVAAKSTASILLKKALVVTGIVAASSTGIYFTFFNNEAVEVEKKIVPKEISENTTNLKEADSENTLVSIDQDKVAELNESEELSDNVTSVNENTTSTGEAEVVNPTIEDRTSVATTPITESVTGNESAATTSNTPPQITSENEENQVVNPNSENKEEETNLQEELAVPPSGKIIVEKGQRSFGHVIFKAEMENTVEVIWDFGDGDIGYGAEATHYYTKPGTYEVSMTLKGKGNTNIVKRKNITITSVSKVEGSYNIITPNGDNRNDFFYVETEEIKSFYFIVFDDKGAEVFSTHDPDFEWYGTDLGGNTLEKGNYSYMIQAIGVDKVTYVIPGSITIE